MKVLYVINNLLKGGTKLLLVDFLRELRRNQQVEFELLLMEYIGYYSNFERLAAYHFQYSHFFQ